MTDPGTHSKEITTPGLIPGQWTYPLELRRGLGLLGAGSLFGRRGYCFTCTAGAPGDQDVGGLPARCPQEADEQRDPSSPCKTSLPEPDGRLVHVPPGGTVWDLGRWAASRWDPGPGANYPFLRVNLLWFISGVRRWKPSGVTRIFLILLFLLLEKVCGNTLV